MVAGNCLNNSTPPEVVLLFNEDLEKLLGHDHL